MKQFNKLYKKLKDITIYSVKVHNYGERKEFSKILHGFLLKDNIPNKITAPRFKNQIIIESFKIKYNIAPIPVKIPYEYEKSLYILEEALRTYGVAFYHEEQNHVKLPYYNTIILTIEYSQYIQDFVKLTTIHGKYPTINYRMLEDFGITNPPQE